MILYRVSSTLCLFADDCLLCISKIKFPQDSISLQKDLDLLSHWASILWQIKFNTTKCIVLRCSRSLISIQYSYQLVDHVFDIKEEHLYLVTQITMLVQPHIKNFHKTSKTFNFLRQTLSKYSPSSSYLTLL